MSRRRTLSKGARPGVEEDPSVQVDFMAFEDLTERLAAIRDELQKEEGRLIASQQDLVKNHKIQPDNMRRQSAFFDQISAEEMKRLSSYWQAEDTIQEGEEEDGDKEAADGSTE